MDRDPQCTNRSFGYHSSGNMFPGGTIAPWVEVTPSSKRITGNTDNAKAQRESISRQYVTTQKKISAVA